MNLNKLSIVLLSTLLLTSAPSFADSAAHNVILFVSDGLRPGMINQNTAPTMAALLKNGVRFSNSHSIFPTFTMANAASFSTGHVLGDNGIFSNTIFTRFPVKAANNSVTPFIENDTVLGELDSGLSGNYLNEETILAAARKKGLSTAAVGKLGPTLMFDHTGRSGNESIIIDDSTGHGGIPLSEDVKARLAKLNLPEAAPTRGDNGQPGDSKTAGAKSANVDQQQYFVDVASKLILPSFKEKAKPFVLVYWSRDPDGTQHNQGDSLNEVTPGINGPTSLAAIKNADNNLLTLQKTLQELGLEETTDIILASDHGFSTISKQSKTSFSTSADYKGVVHGFLPPGFLAIDLAHSLGLPFYDPDNNKTQITAGSTSVKGNALIGKRADQPQVIVAANGGSDLIYLPGGSTALVQKIIDTLSAQDYTSGIFVNDRLGKFAGTLPMSTINLIGTAATPTPDIVVNFRSFSTNCSNHTTCGVDVSDSTLQQGQGMHGSFSRADTMNTMGAIGPDFKKQYDDKLPASNADIGVTIATLLGLDIQPKGKLIGRFLTEATPGGSTGVATKTTLHSAKDKYGHSTVLKLQKLGAQTYLDVAGYPGRTLGLGN